jgi:hypothetical protein
MTITQKVTIDECTTAISDMIGAVFSHVEGWSEQLEQYAEAHQGTVSRAGIDVFVEAMVRAEFDDERLPVIGAGFVAAPGFIADAEWHLAWWLGELNTFGLESRSPHVRRLDAVEDPTSDDFRDYTALEWWRVPLSTGRRHLTGPYVDYLCTDEYTVTLTVPVHFGDRMIGVVGADLYVDEIERRHLPILRALGREATLVNRSGRVIASTDGARSPGSLLRLDDLGDALAQLAPRGTTRLAGCTVAACGDTSIALVVAD